jgi:hypothetical protein
VEEKPETPLVEACRRGIAGFADKGQGNLIKFPMIGLETLPERAAGVKVVGEFCHREGQFVDLPSLETHVVVAYLLKALAESLPEI